MEEGEGKGERGSEGEGGNCLGEIYLERGCGWFSGLLLSDNLRGWGRRGWDGRGYVDVPMVERA